MARAHIVTVCAYVGDSLVCEETRAGRVHRLEMMRAAMRAIDAAGAPGVIRCTESAAKAWALWAYAPGAKEAVRSGSLLK